jgi:cytochrome c-type biogenesis protein CcmH
MLCCLGASFGKEAVPLAEDPAIEQRMIDISEEMRCLVCQNESLSGSRSELAQDLRNELRQLLKDGKTDAEIKEFMVTRYGDFVLYRPPVKTSTWLLWGGPFLLLILAMLFLLRHVGRDGRDEDADEELTEEEKQRAQRLLKGAGK